MARETVYLVQAFKLGKGARLTADAPIRCKLPEGARRTAENLVPANAGVVAFATSGDAELGDYDEEPTVIFKACRLPAPFEEAGRRGRVMPNRLSCIDPLPVGSVRAVP